ncbi:MAG: hypothetical protein J6Y37_11270 [Paludibacteraceae bacterium]|nr:hypothetical protein [Paludibacteraceae bacterium]
MKKYLLFILPLLAMFVLSSCNKDEEEGDGARVNKNNGKLPGKFSVSSSKQVQFSMGNLQYQAATSTWQFAGNQYEVIGEENKEISDSYAGWIDLFGYGTSGYKGKSPYMTSTNYYDYYGDDISESFYDWGQFNKISNGGNKSGLWRALSSEEWNYLLEHSTNFYTSVNEVNGLLILPDDFNVITFYSDSEVLVEEGETFSLADWYKMEAAGVVFLPCAGNRNGSGVGYVGERGFYWSSSISGSYGADDLYFFATTKTVRSDARLNGFSVRLVSEVKEDEKKY